MNLDRFENFVAEFFNCDIDNVRVYETEVEYYYRYELSNGLEFMIKEPKEKEE